jgi:hypothetical protein
VIPSGVRIFLCVGPVGMRLGFDRLAQIARERVGHDPARRGPAAPPPDPTHQKKGPDPVRIRAFQKFPAATYSPTGLPLQYHRPWRS